MNDRRVTVFYDPQIFIAQRHGGISRYFAELIHHFETHPDLGIEPIYVPWAMRLNSHASELLGLKRIQIPRFMRILIFGLGWMFTRKNADVLHLTFYSRLYFRRRSTSVITLYDMLPERFRSGRNPHMSKLFLAEHASALISISNASVIEFRAFGGSDRQADVIHLGASQQFAQSTEINSGFQLPQRYVLFVGQRAGYKRGEWAIRALGKLPSEIHLVFVGPPLEVGELELANSLGLSCRIQAVSPSDSGLAAVYRASLALAYPTAFEGFGLPLIEAMLMKVPIVASDNEINREIAGEYAHYFDSESFDEFVSALRHATSDASHSGQIDLRAGRERALTFTWARCAEETAALYHRLMKQNR